MYMEMKKSLRMIKLLVAGLIIFSVGIIVGIYYRNGSATIPNGCHYEQVQCITAPCDPILVCPSPTLPPFDEGVACTMDAKICPDGSAVGRVAPDCEFSPCP